MNETIGGAAARPLGGQDVAVQAILSPQRCVHMMDGTASATGTTRGCGLTWCDTPWSSSRAGCPWFNARGA